MVVSTLRCCCPQIETSNRFLMGMVALLAACTFALGPLAMFNLYFVPYWINVVWLDAVNVPSPPWAAW